MRGWGGGALGGLKNYYEEPINLVPMTTNLAESVSVNNVDLEAHSTLLEAFMKAFPSKAPAESSIQDGICVLDMYYRSQLSKATTKKSRKLWAAKDFVGRL